MKYIQKLITVAVGGALLALVSSAIAQSVKPCLVTVVRIQGEARYSLGDNAWHPLVVGKILRAGAIIQTAANSSVDIVLSGEPVAMPQAAPSPDQIAFAPDPNIRGLVSYKPMVKQNAIRLWSNTVLAVDKLTESDTGVDAVSDTELDLRAGRVFYNVKKISESSQFIIKIPDGVAGIRGCVGGGSADGSWFTLEGSAVVARGGKVIVVNAGSECGSDGVIITIPQNILDNMWSTVPSVVTLFQSPNGPSSLNQNSDSTQSCGSKVFSIGF
jgi:hypothetical protein